MPDVFFELGTTGAAIAAARGGVVIIVDALRASSTIVTALAHGVRSVRPVSTPEECVGDLTAGERSGHKLPGVDLDNSPLRFVNDDFSGRELVLTTTNGTACITTAASKPGTTVLIGCLLNATAVARVAQAVTRSVGLSVSIVLAGRNGSATSDDLVAASEIFLSFDDARLRGAFELVRSDDFTRDFIESDSGRNLGTLDKLDDIVFCARKDRYDQVPVYRDGLLVPFDEVS